MNFLRFQNGTLELKQGKKTFAINKMNEEMMIKYLIEYVNNILK